MTTMLTGMLNARPSGPDPLRCPASPLFMKRQALIAHVYKEKPPELSMTPNMPTVRTRPVSSSLQAQSLYYSYERARRLNRKIRFDDSKPEPGAVITRLDKFRCGSPNNSTWSPSLFPNAHVDPQLQERAGQVERFQAICEQEPPKKKRVSVSRVPHKRQRTQGSHRLRQEFCRVTALLSHQANRVIHTPQAQALGLSKPQTQGLPESTEVVEAAEVTATLSRVPKALQLPAEDQWTAHIRALSARSAASREQVWSALKQRTAPREVLRRPVRAAVAGREKARSKNIQVDLSPNPGAPVLNDLYLAVN